MADIVERLRELHFPKAVRDAADEIERLRAQLADAETALRVWDAGGCSEYWLRHLASVDGRRMAETGNTGSGRSPTSAAPAGGDAHV